MSRNDLIALVVVSIGIMLCSIFGGCNEKPPAAVCAGDCCRCDAVVGHACRCAGPDANHATTAERTAAVLDAPAVRGSDGAAVEPLRDSRRETGTVTR